MNNIFADVTIPIDGDWPTTPTPPSSDSSTIPTIVAVAVIVIIAIVIDSIIIARTISKKNDKKPS